MSLSDKIYYSRGIPLCQQNLRKNLRNFQTLKIIIKAGENRHFSALFFGFWRHDKLPPFGKFRWPAEIFLFFCGDVTQAPHALCPNPPSLRMGQALRSGRWDSFSAEKPRRLKHATGMFLRAAFRIPPSVKNKDHPDGWSLFWRRRWDSNPRAC